MSGSGIGVLIVQGLPPTQNDNAAPINPFSTVVVTDSDPTALTDATIVISPDADGTLSGGPVLDPIGGGVYEIGSVSPANLTADLESLTFTPTGTATMTTISLSVNGGPASTTNIITPPPPDLWVIDTSTGKPIGTLPPFTPVETPYIGPVADIAHEYINITPDNLNITAHTPNWFIHSGSGTDAIQAFGGTNVLDGGTGSNFLVGAGGHDTFFVDDRAPSADIWSTVVNFHPSDDATVWGITPANTSPSDMSPSAMFNITVADGQGAVGADGVDYRGLTFHFTKPGVPEASLTLTGFTKADLTNGKLTQSFGTDAASGSPYMLIHVNTA